MLDAVIFLYLYLLGKVYIEIEDYSHFDPRHFLFEQFKITVFTLLFVGNSSFPEIFEVLNNSIF